MTTERVFESRNDCVFGCGKGLIQFIPLALDTTGKFKSVTFLLLGETLTSADKSIAKTTDRAVIRRGFFIFVCLVCFEFSPIITIPLRKWERIVQLSYISCIAWITARTTSSPQWLQQLYLRRRRQANQKIDPLLLALNADRASMGLHNFSHNAQAKASASALTGSPCPPGKTVQIRKIFFKNSWPSSSTLQIKNLLPSLGWLIFWTTLACTDAFSSRFWKMLRRRSSSPYGKVALRNLQIYGNRILTHSGFKIIGSSLNQLFQITMLFLKTWLENRDELTK